MYEDERKEVQGKDSTGKIYIYVETGKGERGKNMHLKKENDSRGN